MSSELKKFVMWGSYCENVLEKRTPFRQEHLDNLKALHDAGKLLSIGPTQDISKVFGIYAAASLEEAKQMVEGDVYWTNQIWTDYEIYEWTQVY